MQVRRDARNGRGAAAVEFAFLLPLLAFLFVVAVDWGRIFYYTITCENCARNGVLYLSDPVVQQNSPYASVTAAALADATDLSPQPSVSSSSGTDGYGKSYVQVTVTYSFTTITHFTGGLEGVGGVPHSTSVTRTVQKYVAPTLPK